jgi:hypothetical protein
MHEHVPVHPVIKQTKQLFDFSTTNVFCISFFSIHHFCIFTNEYLVTESKGVEFLSVVTVTFYPIWFTIWSSIIDTFLKNNFLCKMWTISCNFFDGFNLWNLWPSLDQLLFIWGITYRNLIMMTYMYI